MRLGIDEAIRELKAISKQKPLEGDDLERFKEICKFLREDGFTNAEISKLTGGRYKEVTIKQYTRGSRVKSTEAKDKALGLLSDLIDWELDLVSVDRTIQLEQRLQEKNLSVDRLASFVEQALATNTDIATIVTVDAKLNELKITLGQAPGLIQYFEQIRAEGVQPRSLKAVVEAAAKFGPPQQVLEAMNSYGSKQAIDKAIAISTERKARIDADVTKADSNYRSIQEKTEVASQSIHTLNRLEKQGLTEAKMLHIEMMCARLGGLEQAELKLSRYAQLQQLDNEVTLRKSELERFEQSMAHRQKVNKIAEKLLTKFKFNLSAIDEVYAAAEECGEPVEVIRKINRFGDMKKIEEQIEKTDTELIANELEIKRQSDFLDALELTIENHKKQLQQYSEGIIKEMGEAFKNATNSIAVEHQKGIDRVSKFQQQYAETMAKIVMLENELKMAKILMTVRNFPEEVVKWPLELAVQLLEGAARFCRAKTANPTIQLKKQLEEKYGLTYVSPVNIAFQDLVEWAIEALRLYSGRTRVVVPP